MSEVKTDQQKIDDILSRGVENIIPDKQQLEELLKSGKKLNVYLGVDPTATRIHIGHAFPLRKLNLLAEMGHNVIFLIGDFTAKIGDTSDKDTERPMLTDEEIKQNFEDYKSQASRLIDFDKVKVVFNSEWLSKLSFADVINLTRHFSVNDFVSRELIRKRLDAGTRVSLPEVLYPIMQGYDSYHLEADIQFGGTDQTFNMQAGRTLNKKLRDGKESFIVANGFLPGTDGRKMSKSWGNAIWLDDPAQEIFGKVMSISDDAIEDYYLYGTNVPIDEIKNRLKADNPMEIKKELAREVVRELRGEDEIDEAQKHFESTVQSKVADDDAPREKVSGKLSGQQLLELIVENSLVNSKSEARRLFDQNSIRVNDEQVSLDQDIDLETGENTVRVGKRRYLILENE